MSAEGAAARRAETAAVLAQFDGGEPVSTVEMGGIGPGYEQALQLAAIAIVRALLDEPVPDHPAEDWGDAPLRAVSAKLGGITGAMADGAKSLAWKILAHGWRAAVDSAPDDRRILVSTNWPRLES